MQLQNLSDLFQRSLEFAWDCEHRLLDEMPRFADAVQSTRLRQEFVQNHEDTGAAIARLEQIFAKLDRAPCGETGDPVRAMIGEAGKVINHLEPSPLRDAALIFLANQTAHYRIALYGSACAFARTLSLYDLALSLEISLEQARASDRFLTV